MPSMNIEVMTKFKLNTCDPYVIKYPRPFLDTKSSPIITPIKDRLIFIFKVFTKFFVFPLRTSFVNICILFAPNVFNSIIFCLSVLIKALYILIIAVNTVIKSVIKIIELVFAPIQIIISGPSDTLGSEFRTVR